MKGSIRQRKAGGSYTCYWFVVDASTGRRRQHSRGGFKTKGAAQKHLNSVLSKVEEGSWRPDKPLTVQQLLRDHWLPAQRSRELRPSTLNQYVVVVDKWIVPKLGAVKVAALTPQQVVDFSEQLRTARTSTGRTGLSPRSRQIAVGLLKSACAWAVDNGLLGRNPIRGVRRPSGKSKAVAPWTAPQARLFLDATRDDRLAPAWALLLARGLRRGEVCGLRWRNVDLDAGTLLVVETRVVVDGKAVASEPKTASGRRTVPLDDRLVALLRGWKARQGREKMAAVGGAYDDGGFVFCDELGRPYHPDTLSAWFEDATKTAGLPRIRLHDTRHTAATLMLSDGVPPKVVSELLGHSSVNITLAVYGHVLPGMSEQAGADLSARLLD